MFVFRVLWGTAPRILHLDHRWKWVDSFIPRPEAPGTHWTGGWVDPRPSLDLVEKKKNSCPSRESNLVMSSAVPFKYLHCAYVQVVGCVWNEMLKWPYYGEMNAVSPWLYPLGRSRINLMTHFTLCGRCFRTGADLHLFCDSRSGGSHRLPLHRYISTVMRTVKT
jgi:hypothetical protein